MRAGYCTDQSPHWRGSPPQSLLFMPLYALPQVKAFLMGARKKAGYADDAFVQLQIRHSGATSMFFDENMLR